MKKQLFFYLFLWLTTGLHAQTPPLFSDPVQAVWYYVRFTVNGSVIQDMGSGQPLKNRMPDESKDGQLWILTGRADSCELVSKEGRRLFYNQSQNRCQASDTEGTALTLVASDAGNWELQVRDHTLVPSAGALSLVMNGGSGTDKIIDLWKHNFGACALEFVPVDEMDFTFQTAPAEVAEVAVASRSVAPAEPLSLWYREPARNWVTQALPIGGGDFGAMVFGGVAQDHLQFNHKTLWRGSRKTGDLGTYLNFGDLYLINKNAAAVTDYQRQLDIHRAVASVEYTQGDVNYRREYLASYPGKVIAVRYTADKGTPLHVELQLINAQGERAGYTPDGACFSGTLDNGMHYCASLALSHTGGTVIATRSGIEVKDASELTLYLACGTDFDPARDNHLTGDAVALKTEMCRLSAEACVKGYAAVREEHEADHRRLFDRVTLELDGAKSDLPTDRLLQKQADPAYAAQLDMLVFQYGRYLTIASSRGVDLPSNLQGIWNKDGNATSSAVWASDIHSNINVQMNYWPAEPTNLSECHMPFINYIRNEALRPGGTWQQNATDLNMSRGWVVNTAGNIFGGSSTYKVGKYAVANAWYCEHLWQHFTYTRDMDYLRSTAYPLMKSACEFWFERLVEAADGTLECPNEYSPEQGRVQNATAHSQQLVTQLFINTLKAIDELGGEVEFADRLRRTLTRIDRGLRVGTDGMMREWKYQENTPNLPADGNYFADDEQNVWQCHRHTSHLMALYPGFEIDPGKDGRLFAAAVASLADRGDVATGWARAWRIALWARARDGEHAYTTLRGFAHRTTTLSYDWHGGLYDNLLDAHATSVFQIEGNFGATAGVAEMLLQSRPDSLVLLPALPDVWSNGHVTGLKAMGNFDIDLTWKEGRAVSLTVTSRAGQPLTLAYPGLERATLTSDEDPSVTADTSVPSRLSLATRAGAVYTIRIPVAATGVRSDARVETFGVTVNGGRICVEGDDNPFIYDVAGRQRHVDARLQSGIYVVRSRQSVRAVAVP
ncbi:MAG: glycoside hydrolase family 95 protein [Clostridium sp.]|nr:glycoside hydrolase family 95 protein [Clostridium sp.]